MPEVRAGLRWDVSEVRVVGSRWDVSAAVAGGGMKGLMSRWGPLARLGWRLAAASRLGRRSAVAGSRLSRPRTRPVQPGEPATRPQWRPPPPS